MYVGWALIIVGLIFLLKHLGVLVGPTWGIIWPWLLIILGLIIITRRGKAGCWFCGGGRKEKKMEGNP